MSPFMIPGKLAGPGMLKSGLSGSGGGRGRWGGETGRTLLNPLYLQVAQLRRRKAGHIADTTQRGKEHPSWSQAGLIFFSPSFCSTMRFSFSGTIRERGRGTGALRLAPGD